MQFANSIKPKMSSQLFDGPEIRHPRGVGLGGVIRERMLHDGVELHVSGSHVAEQSPRSDGASALRPQERPEREETFWVDTTIFNH